MRKAKIAITLDQDLLDELDRMIDGKQFLNRSVAIQESVREKLERVERNRLVTECAKLDPTIEKGLAEEGIAGEIDQWPEY